MEKKGIVTSFKLMYLGAVVSRNGSNPKVLARIAQATAALTKGCQFGELATYFLGQSGGSGRRSPEKRHFVFYEN